MRKLVFYYLITGILIQFISCANLGVDNLGTIRTDDTPEGWWRPSLDSLHQEFTDSMNNQLEFSSPGLIKQFNIQEGSYANSPGKYSATFESKIVSYGSNGGAYSITYTLEPNYSDEPMWDVDKLHISIFDLINDELICEVDETVDMDVYCHFSDSIILNNKLFKNDYKSYLGAQGDIYFIKHRGVIGFDHHNRLWVVNN